MFSTRFTKSWRPFVYCLAVTIVAATVVALVNRDIASGTVSAQVGPTVESPATVFPGTGTGAIPDQGTFTTCGAFLASPLNISFAVTGITAPLTDVRVSLTGTHTFVGDMDATLTAPGGSPSFLIMPRKNATTATACGSAGSFAGPYVFFDTAPTSPTWFTATNSTGVPVPAGNYRASAALTGTTTLITPAFAGLTTGQVNGTWTLAVRDVSGTDTGSITAASLELVGTAGTPTPTPTPTPAPTATPPDTFSDFDGDGSTDYAVVRNAGGPSGQATWFVSLNASGTPIQRDWGLGSDTFIPGDYDGDGRDDFAVWRAGAQSTFYIINSSNNTITVDNFGIAGDDPSVVGDYNNDNRDDVAVYRSGATAGSQSNWYWKNASTGTIYNMPWGLNGDFVAPGDYNGDNANDYAIQRSVGGTSVFYVRISSGGPDVITSFGLAGDIVVNADYDGDKKTDLAVVTANGANWRWSYRPSLGGGDVVNDWGIVATDYPTPGDYNGDGKADYAIWRPGALSTFHVMRPVTLQISSRQWGLIDDIPVNNVFAH